MISDVDSAVRVGTFPHGIRHFFALFPIEAPYNLTGILPDLLDIGNLNQVVLNDQNSILYIIGLGIGVKHPMIIAFDFIPIANNNIFVAFDFIGFADDDVVVADELVFDLF